MCFDLSVNITLFIFMDLFESIYRQTAFMLIFWSIEYWMSEHNRNANKLISNKICQETMVLYLGIIVYCIILLSFVLISSKTKKWIWRKSHKLHIQSSSCAFAIRWLNIVVCNIAHSSLLLQSSLQLVSVFIKLKMHTVE